MDILEKHWEIGRRFAAEAMQRLFPDKKYEKRKKRLPGMMLKGPNGEEPIYVIDLGDGAGFSNYVGE